VIALEDKQDSVSTTEIDTLRMMMQFGEQALRSATGLTARPKAGRQAPWETAEFVG
jgi:hypothetical protein